MNGCLAMLMLKPYGIDGFVKSGLFRWRGIFAESNSKKHPHCHFERQREILNNQDSSSLSFLGMTAAKASKIISNIVEFLRSNPPGRLPGTEPKSNFYCMLDGTETIHPHCHFERQREILNNQDASSLSLPGI